MKEEVKKDNKEKLTKEEKAAIKAKKKEEKAKKKEEKKANKTNKEKDHKKMSEIMEKLKKNWLFNGITTLILVLVLVLVFLLINIGMQKLDLTPLDFTQEKLHTLTDESKEKVKDIDQEVNIYFVGYSDTDSDLDLAKQYNKVNEKISAEAIDENSRPDLTEKYGLESGSEGIIVESGERYKVLTSSDLVTYDTSTYETISIAEEKLTSAIVSVTTAKIPKVYFLEGYSSFSLSENMQYLNMLLANEINEIDTLNILTEGKVPDDCDTLVITTPSKDFDDIATAAITDYINSGKNILWLNAAQTSTKDLTNVNKILELYGVDPFSVGIIRETDSGKMLSGSSDVIMPEIESSTITKNIYNTTGPIFINATKVNIADSDTLEELNVVKTVLAKTSDGAYFRTDFNNEQTSKADDEEEGSFVVGAELEKTIQEKDEENNQEAITSKLVIYGENYFATDYQLSQSSQYAAVQLGYNKELVMDSISYLVDREEDISARKDTGTVTYTATEEQDTIIKVIIFAVPILIIIIGIIVWQVRRRRK